VTTLAAAVNPMLSRSWVSGVPHEAFAQLRREPRPQRLTGADGRRYWALVRHVDVTSASRNPEVFSNEPDPFTMSGSDPDGPHLPLLISLDPPAHTQRRQLVNKGFTPRRVTRLTDRIREIVAEQLNRVKGQERFDFVTDLAVELPLQVIAELLGIPAKDRKAVFSWTEQMMSGDDAEFANKPDEVVAALGQMYGYAEELCHQREQQPGEDLMSALLGAELDGQRLSQLDLNLFFLLLHNAGSETTRNLVTGGVLALLENPDQLELLCAEPERIRVAVEELLRWVTPVTHFARTATRPFDVAGQPIAAGEQMLLWYTSANRDESVFTAPEQLDVTREPNPHVAFGAGGPHFCLGAHLARLEATCLFEALMDQLPRLELAGEVQRLQSHFINGVKHLPLRWR
jgi:cholest-4-en-3-one 26-monooxygenase